MSVLSLDIAGADLAMPIEPLWVLEYFRKDIVRLELVTIFITVFFAVVRNVTNSRVIDARGAAVAYAVVLMVFMQIRSGTNKLTRFNEALSWAVAEDVHTFLVIVH